MKNIKRTRVTNIEDTQRAFENIWQILEQLPIYWGNGSPENAVVANRGSVYFDLQGSTNTTLYIKEATDGKNSGWSAV